MLNLGLSRSSAAAPEQIILRQNTKVELSLSADKRVVDITRAGDKITFTALLLQNGLPLANYKVFPINGSQLFPDRGVISPAEAVITDTQGEATFTYTPANREDIIEISAVAYVNDNRVVATVAPATTNKTTAGITLAAEGTTTPPADTGSYTPADTAEDTTENPPAGTSDGATEPATTSGEEETASAFTQALQALTTWLQNQTNSIGEAVSGLTTFLTNQQPAAEPAAPEPVYTGTAFYTDADGGQWIDLGYSCTPVGVGAGSLYFALQCPAGGGRFAREGDITFGSSPIQRFIGALPLDTNTGDNATYLTGSNGHTFISISSFRKWAEDQGAAELAETQMWLTDLSTKTAVAAGGAETDTTLTAPTTDGTPTDGATATTDTVQIAANDPSDTSNATVDNFVSAMDRNTAALEKAQRERDKTGQSEPIGDDKVQFQITDVRENTDGTGGTIKYQVSTPQINQDTNKSPTGGGNYVLVWSCEPAVCNGGDFWNKPVNIGTGATTYTENILFSGQPIDRDIKVSVKLFNVQPAVGSIKETTKEIGSAQTTLHQIGPTQEELDQQQQTATEGLRFEVAQVGQAEIGTTQVNVHASLTYNGEPAIGKAEFNQEDVDKIGRLSKTGAVNILSSGFDLKVIIDPTKVPNDGYAKSLSIRVTATAEKYPNGNPLPNAGQKVDATLTIQLGQEPADDDTGDEPPSTGGEPQPPLGSDTDKDQQQTDPASSKKLFMTIQRANVEPSDPNDPDAITTYAVPLEIRVFYRGNTTEDTADKTGGDNTGGSIPPIIPNPNPPSDGNNPKPLISTVGEWLKNLLGAAYAAVTGDEITPPTVPGLPPSENPPSDGGGQLTPPADDKKDGSDSSAATDEPVPNVKFNPVQDGKVGGEFTPYNQIPEAVEGTPGLFVLQYAPPRDIREAGGTVSLLFDATDSKTKENVKVSFSLATKVENPESAAAWDRTLTIEGNTASEGLRPSLSCLPVCPALTSRVGDMVQSGYGGFLAGMIMSPVLGTIGNTPGASMDKRLTVNQIEDEKARGRIQEDNIGYVNLKLTAADGRPVKDQDVIIRVTTSGAEWTTGAVAVNPTGGNDGATAQASNAIFNSIVFANKTIGRTSKENGDINFYVMLGHNNTTKDIEVCATHQFTNKIGAGVNARACITVKNLLKAAATNNQPGGTGADEKPSPYGSSEEKDPSRTVGVSISPSYIELPKWGKGVTSERRVFKASVSYSSNVGSGTGQIAVSTGGDIKLVSGASNSSSLTAGKGGTVTHNFTIEINRDKPNGSVIVKATAPAKDGSTKTASKTITLTMRAPTPEGEDKTGSLSIVATPASLNFSEGQSPDSAPGVIDLKVSVVYVGLSKPGIDLKITPSGGVRISQGDTSKRLDTASSGNGMAEYSVRLAADSKKAGDAVVTIEAKATRSKKVGAHTEDEAVIATKILKATTPADQAYNEDPSFLSIESVTPDVLTFEKNSQRVQAITVKIKTPAKSAVSPVEGGVLHLKATQSAGWCVDEGDSMAGTPGCQSLPALFPSIAPNGKTQSFDFSVTPDPNIDNRQEGHLTIELWGYKAGSNARTFAREVVQLHVGSGSSLSDLLKQKVEELGSAISITKIGGATPPRVYDVSIPKTVHSQIVRDVQDYDSSKPVNVNISVGSGVTDGDLRFAIGGGDYSSSFVIDLMRNTEARLSVDWGKGGGVSIVTTLQAGGETAGTQIANWIFGEYDWPQNPSGDNGQNQQPSNQPWKFEEDLPLGVLDSDATTGNSRSTVNSSSLLSEGKKTAIGKNIDSGSDTSIGLAQITVKKALEALPESARTSAEARKLADAIVHLRLVKSANDVLANSGYSEYEKKYVEQAIAAFIKTGDITALEKLKDLNMSMISDLAKTTRDNYKKLGFDIDRESPAGPLYDPLAPNFNNTMSSAYSLVQGSSALSDNDKRLVQQELDLIKANSTYAGGTSYEELKSAVQRATANNTGSEAKSLYGMLDRVLLDTLMLNLLDDNSLSSERKQFAKNLVDLARQGDMSGFDQLSLLPGWTNLDQRARLKHIKEELIYNRNRQGLSAGAYDLSDAGTASGGLAAVFDNLFNIFGSQAGTDSAGQSPVINIWNLIVEFFQNLAVRGQYGQ
ncbi:MAG: hypothetical protein V1826_01335 [bacterium]